MTGDEIHPIIKSICSGFNFDPLTGIYAPGLKVTVCVASGEIMPLYWRLRCRENLEILGRIPARQNFPIEAGYILTDGRCGFSCDPTFVLGLVGTFAIDLSRSPAFNGVVCSAVYSICLFISFVFIFKSK